MQIFIREVLKMCENKPKFVVDKAPWLVKELESECETFREEKLG